MNGHTPGEWKYGVRKDDSIWLSLGDPVNGPHYQGDFAGSVDDVQLVIAAPALKEALEGSKAALEECANILRARFPSLADNVIGAHLKVVDAALALSNLPNKT